MDVLVQNINQLNMTIQNIYQFNQQTFDQIGNELNATMQKINQ